MKKALLVVLFAMVAVSWCLAQGNDPDTALTAPAPQDTVKVTVVNSLPGGPNSIPHTPNWVLGMEPASLAPKDLPGMVFLQRRISGKFYLGMGFHYYISNEGPNESYNKYDSTRSTTERKYSSISLKPELSWKAIGKKSYGGGLALSVDITKSFTSSSQEYRDESSYPHYSIDNADDYTYRYGLGIPFFIEKYFKLWGQPVSLGIKNNILSFGGGWIKHKHYREYYDEYDSYFGMSLYEDTDRLPRTFSLDNPFQGKTQVTVKYYF